MNGTEAAAPLALSRSLCGFWIHTATLSLHLNLQVFKVDELLFSVEEKMARDVVTWWQSFAATGSPGTAPSGQAWPAFTADAGNVLIWNADHDRYVYVRMCARASGLRID